MTQSISQKFFCCLSLTNYLISKLRLPYIGVIFAIVESRETPDNPPFGVPEPAGLPDWYDNYDEDHDDDL